MCCICEFQAESDLDVANGYGYTRTVHHLKAPCCAAQVLGTHQLLPHPWTMIVEQKTLLPHGALRWAPPAF